MRQRCGEGRDPVAADPVAANTKPEWEGGRREAASVRDAASGRSVCLGSVGTHSRVVSAWHCGSTAARAFAPSAPMLLFATLHAGAGKVRGEVGGCGSGHSVRTGTQKHEDVLE